MLCNPTSNSVAVLLFQDDPRMAAYTFPICEEISKPANHRNRHRRKPQTFRRRVNEIRDHYK